MAGAGRAGEASIAGSYRIGVMGTRRFGGRAGRLPRRADARIGALVCLLIAVLALAGACANQIPGSGRVVGISTTDPTSASPSRAPTQTVSPSASAYSAVCPNIIDNEARLAYRCVDDSLLIDPGAAASAGLTLALEAPTEANWVAMQGSGHAKSVSGASAKLVAQNAVAEMVRSDYGASPSSAVQKEGDVKLGRSAYRIDTLVTINPGYANQHGLQVKQELLSVTVVEVAQGEFSIMMITVPDTEKAWWQRIDAVVEHLRVV